MIWMYWDEQEMPVSSACRDTSDPLLRLFPTSVGGLGALGEGTGCDVLLAFLFQSISGLPVACASPSSLRSSLRTCPTKPSTRCSSSCALMRVSADTSVFADHGGGPMCAVQSVSPGTLAGSTFRRHSRPTCGPKFSSTSMARSCIASRHVHKQQRRSAS